MHRSSLAALLVPLVLGGCSALVDFGSLAFDGADGGLDASRRDLGVPALDASDERVLDLAGADLRDVGQPPPPDLGAQDLGADVRDLGLDARVHCTGTRTCHPVGGMLDAVECLDESRATCLDAITAPYDWCACNTLPAVYFVPPSGTGSDRLTHVILIAPRDRGPFSLEIRGLCAGLTSTPCDLSPSCEDSGYAAFVWDVEDFGIRPDAGTADDEGILVYEDDTGAPCCGGGGECQDGVELLRARWMR